MSVVIARPDGTGARRLARQAASPDWSPEGSRLAHVGHDGTYANVYVLDRAGHGTRRLLVGAETDPVSWSPNGQWLAYGSHGAVSAVRPNGGGRRQLATGGFEYDYAWSPDGRSLAIAHRGRILIVRPEGGSRKEISIGKGAFVGTPTWSSDGKQIFFAAAKIGSDEGRFR